MKTSQACIREQCIHDPPIIIYIENEEDIEEEERMAKPTRKLILK